MDITTRFMGLELSNPVVVSSSTLTANIDAVQKAVKAGAGAVILKSLFEEDIVAAMQQVPSKMAIVHPEAAQYTEQMSMLLEPDTYLAFVEECAASVNIPVIASLNCHSSKWWVDYAERIAAMGADGIELNLSPIAVNTQTTSMEIENSIVEMVKIAREAVSIPLAVKIGPGFSALPHLASRIHAAGANALTLFNRFYQFDIDIESIEFHSGNSLSVSEEFGSVLRWIGILAGTSQMDLAASTGIYDAKALIKTLLAGGHVAQLCSVLYRQGLGVIGEILDGLQSWMEEHGYENIADFHGFLSVGNEQKNQAYQRLQYVKALKGK